MRAIVLVFSLLASALAATAPDIEEVGDIVLCIRRCTGLAKANAGLVQPCLDSCNLSLGKDIQETLARMPVLAKDAAIIDDDDYFTVYRDGLLLQGDLAALKTVISQDNKRAQPGANNLLGALFGNLLQPAGAPAQPSLGTLMKIPEKIIKLLEQVINNQRVIEQRIASCKHGKPASLKGNYYIAPSNFGIPVNNRRPIIAINAAGKKPDVVPVVRSDHAQKRDFDGFYFPVDETYPSVSDPYPSNPYAAENFYFSGDNNFPSELDKFPSEQENFPSELDKFPYEENYPVDSAITFPDDRR